MDWLVGLDASDCATGERAGASVIQLATFALSLVSRKSVLGRLASLLCDEDALSTLPLS